MAGALPTRVAQVAALAVPGSQAAVVGIVGPGGSDAPAILDAVAARLGERGVGVMRTAGRRLERHDPLGALAGLVDVPADPGDPATERKVRDMLLDRLAAGPAALVVEDAQWLDPTSLRVVVGVVERAADRGVTVTVSHRPAPGDPAIAALDAAVARRVPLVVLTPLDENGVAELAALATGRAVDQQVVEALAEHTGGVPWLVERLARAWAAEPPVLPATGPDLAVPPALVEVLRAEVDQLPVPARTALGALSAGADLDDELLRRVTGLTDDDLGAAVAELRSAGLLSAGEDVVPLVAAAVMELTPEPDRRRFHARLADALVARGAPPMQAAEHLALAGAKGEAAADAFVRAGDALLGESPELARGWFERAVDAGAPHALVASRQAEAAALDGDTPAAFRLADLAVSDPAAAERDRAQAVLAALLPSRGLWRRSARAYADLAGGTGARADIAALLAALASLVTGGAARVGSDEKADSGLADDVVAGGPAPRALVAAARERIPAPASLAVEALALTAEGVAATLDDRASGALAGFVEAADLLEAARGRTILPDTPHALGALTALALCEPTAAEHLLTRALDHGAGGPGFEDRHRLLLGWVGLRQGRWGLAQSALDRPGPDRPAPDRSAVAWSGPDGAQDRASAPRDVLLAAAIEAGLARRSGDLAALSTAWGKAEPVLLRHPADLFSLEVVGELSISATRLGLWDRIAEKARELGDIVRSLGSPPLWLLPLRWVGLQVALAGDDREAAARRAAEVAAVTPAHPRLAGLSAAAEAWVEVLENRVDVDRVQAAAAALAGLGLTWEASRLTGQAAIRAGDASVTRSLLEQARDLKAVLPAGDTAEVPVAASVLSEREQTVAQYVVDGLTHKEIGAQLYISPKTVEHHVAKIRQKLGASTRAEMMAALKTQLAS